MRKTILAGLGALALDACGEQAQDFDTCEQDHLAGEKLDTYEDSLGRDFNALRNKYHLALMKRCQSEESGSFALMNDFTYVQPGGKVASDMRTSIYGTRSDTVQEQTCFRESTALINTLPGYCRSVYLGATDGGNLYDKPITDIKFRLVCDEYAIPESVE